MIFPSGEVLRAVSAEAVAHYHARVAQPFFGHPPLQNKWLIGVHVR